MKRRQKGMAVVMALLVVALAVSAAALVMWQQGLWWRQVETDRQRAQVALVTESGIEWALSMLAYNNQSSSAVYLGQLWASPLPPTDAEGVRLRGQLYDMQARFNINALAHGGDTADPLRVEQYRRLLAGLGLAPSLADSLLRWMRLRLPPEGSKAPLSAAPVTAHLLERIGMLAWVEGYTPEVRARLAPYVAALPAEVKFININTAPPLLLRALLPELGSGDLELLQAQRKVNYFRDVADVQSRLRSVATVTTLGQWLGVGSAYFGLDCDVRQGKVVLRTRALLQVDGAHTRLRWREEGAPPVLTVENHDNAATVF
ncbi:type II secretion system minor pseudopilin GspK [Paludibacterium yongneupense]|uniref:type II secretion system minor pseudopilin GspK n=1 Tax=Paludibacterium yongneupense TaxID=400061 RepID=UPI00041755CF|nr:type II secretion system minor pseudopilin GspK [Paludibacterium yongneupense]